MTTPTSAPVNGTVVDMTVDEVLAAAKPGDLLIVDTFDDDATYETAVGHFVYATKYTLVLDEPQAAEHRGEDVFTLPRHFIVAIVNTAFSVPPDAPTPTTVSHFVLFGARGLSGLSGRWLPLGVFDTEAAARQVRDNYMQNNYYDQLRLHEIVLPPPSVVECPTPQYEYVGAR